jgi:acyl carrier protein
MLQFIRDELASGGDASAITEDAPLIDRGIIDSMGLMRILAFIEERTTVRVPDEEVVPENFQTIASIDALVQRLQSRR